MSTFECTPIRLVEPFGYENGSQEPFDRKSSMNRGAMTAHFMANIGPEQLDVLCFIYHGGSFTGSFTGYNQMSSKRGVRGRALLLHDEFKKALYLLTANVKACLPKVCEFVPCLLSSASQSTTPFEDLEKLFSESIDKELAGEVDEEKGFGRWFNTRQSGTHSAYIKLVSKVLWLMYEVGKNGLAAAKFAGLNLRIVDQENRKPGLMYRYLSVFAQEVDHVLFPQQQHADSSKASESRTVSLCSLIQQTLVVGTLFQQDLASGYLSCIFSSSILAALYSPEDRTFCHVDKAIKVDSAIKWYMRASLLMEVFFFAKSLEARRLQVQLSQVLKLKNGAYTFGSLAMLQNCINVFKKVRLDTLVVDHSGVGRLFVNGIPFGFPQLRAILHLKLLPDLAERFTKLSFEYRWDVAGPSFFPHLFGLAPPPGQGLETSLPGFALGVNADDTDRFSLLFDFKRLKDLDDKSVGLHSPEEERLFVDETQFAGPAALEKYLESCLEFESVALVVMHFLTCFSDRAADFEQYTFCNTTSNGIAKVRLYDAETLICEGVSSKHFLQRNLIKTYFHLVPIRPFRHVIAYWLMVRPFAVIIYTSLLDVHGHDALRAAELVERFGEISRWKTSCFVKATPVGKKGEENDGFDHPEDR